MRDATTDIDGRTVAFADYGPAGATPVLWCHGGPGSRWEPAPLAGAAAEAGLRLVGIDRPGYGGSTPQPGRTIAGWVADALVVAGLLGLDRFATVGVSTGGAYALALAALAPERVLATVLCAAMTDMSCDSCRSTMDQEFTRAVWDATDRDAAMAASAAAHGPNGSRLVERAAQLAPADARLFRDPAWLASMRAEAVPAMFAFGFAGYADDRLADRDGWTGFDPAAVRAPVVVLHGGDDRIVDPSQARHTASLVPGARLQVVEGHGHFSITPLVVPVLAELLAGASR